MVLLMSNVHKKNLSSKTNIKTNFMFAKTKKVSQLSKLKAATLYKKAGLLATKEVMMNKKSNTLQNSTSRNFKFFKQCNTLHNQKSMNLKKINQTIHRKNALLFEQQRNLQKKSMAYQAKMRIPQFKYWQLHNYLNNLQLNQQFYKYYRNNVILNKKKLNYNVNVSITSEINLKINNNVLGSQLVLDLTNISDKNTFLYLILVNNSLLFYTKKVNGITMKLLNNLHLDQNVGKVCIKLNADNNLANKRLNYNINLSQRKLEKCTLTFKLYDSKALNYPYWLLNTYFKFNQVHLFLPYLTNFQQNFIESANKQNLKAYVFNMITLRKLFTVSQTFQDWVVYFIKTGTSLVENSFGSQNCGVSKVNVGLARKYAIHMYSHAKIFKSLSTYLKTNILNLSQSGLTSNPFTLSKQSYKNLGHLAPKLTDVLKNSNKLKVVKTIRNINEQAYYKALNLSSPALTEQSKSLRIIFGKKSNSLNNTHNLDFFPQDILMGEAHNWMTGALLKQLRVFRKKDTNFLHLQRYLRGYMHRLVRTPLYMSKILKKLKRHQRFVKYKGNSKLFRTLRLKKLAILRRRHLIIKKGAIKGKTYRAMLKTKLVIRALNFMTQEFYFLDKFVSHSLDHLIQLDWKNQNNLLKAISWIFKWKRFNTMCVLVDTISNIHRTKRLQIRRLNKRQRVKGQQAIPLTRRLWFGLHTEIGATHIRTKYLYDRQQRAKRSNQKFLRENTFWSEKRDLRKKKKKNYHKALWKSRSQIKKFSQLLWINRLESALYNEHRPSKIWEEAKKYHENRKKLKKSRKKWKSRAIFFAQKRAHNELVHRRTKFYWKGVCRGLKIRIARLGLLQQRRRKNRKLPATIWNKLSLRVRFNKKLKKAPRAFFKSWKNFRKIWRKVHGVPQSQSAIRTYRNWVPLRRHFWRKWKLRQHFAKFYGGLSRKQFLTKLTKIKNIQGEAKYRWVEKLEERLDVFVSRLKLVHSRAAAARLIKQGWFLVNGREVRSPQYPVKKNDDVLFFLEERLHRTYWIIERLFSPKPFHRAKMLDAEKNRMPITSIKLNFPESVIKFLYPFGYKMTRDLWYLSWVELTEISHSFLNQLTVKRLKELYMTKKFGGVSENAKSNTSAHNFLNSTTNTNLKTLDAIGRTNILTRYNAKYICSNKNSKTQTKFSKYLLQNANISTLLSQQSIANNAITKRHQKRLLRKKKRIHQQIDQNHMLTLVNKTLKQTKTVTSGWKQWRLMNHDWKAYYAYRTEHLNVKMDTNVLRGDRFSNIKVLNSLSKRY